MEFDLNRSISELEGWKWKSAIPGEDDSYVTQRFYELHNRPVSELDLSDIRFLIGQNSGLKYLVPLAIEKLKENLFVEVEYYPGDLFCSLLLINNEPNYWSEHSFYRQELITLYENQKKAISSLDITEENLRKIKGDYKRFLTL